MVYTVFVDLKAAFDNIDREELWKTMDIKNVSKELATRIMRTYEETSTCVRVNNIQIGSFWINEWVRQGCNLSSDDFNIYLSYLE